jgi:hypothetical protein
MSAADSLINDIPEVRIDPMTKDMIGEIPDFNNFLGFDSFDSFDTWYSIESSFPVHCLPKEVSDMCKAVATSLHIDVSMPAVASLGALSLCLTGSFELQVKSTYREKPNLYLLVSAEPSKKKSPVLRLMFNPIMDEQKRYNDSIKLDYRRYLDRLETARNTLGNLKKFKPRKTSTADHEADIQKARNEVEDILKHPVKCLNLRLTDTTAEALAKDMKDNNEIMAIVDDEASTLQIVMGMYGDGKSNIDIFLKSWSGDFVSISRSMKDSIQLHHPLLTMCLFTQPSIVDEMLSDSQMTNRGMMQRFLYCIPPAKIEDNVSFITPEIPDTVQAAYKNLLVNLIRTYKENVSQFDEPFTLELSDEAMQEYDTFYKKIGMTFSSNTELMREVLIKLQGLCLRLAIILHISSGCPKSEKISLNTMKNAVRLSEYFKTQDMKIFSDLSLEVLDAQFLISRILLCDKTAKTAKTDKYITIRDIKRACGKRFKSESDMYAGLDELIDRGYIRMYQIKNDKGGRPSIRVEINPAVYEN